MILRVKITVHKIIEVSTYSIPTKNIKYRCIIELFDLTM